LLEKPSLPDELIRARAQDAFGLDVRGVTFLPLGADMGTAVYRAVSGAGSAYFLELRKEPFDAMSVVLPRFLYDQGIRVIIPPLRTVDGELSAPLGAADFRMILYPFITGKDGYERDLTNRQWIEFGTALRAIHDMDVAEEYRPQIRRETYSARWRAVVMGFQERAEQDHFADPAAANFAAGMRKWKPEIDHMLLRAEELAEALRHAPGEFVLCHTDLHPGNLHLGDDGSLYIVDWDAPLFARRERDLMYAGAGISNSKETADQKALFEQGYGQAAVDHAALAYYRYERIVEDIAAFGQQLLESEEGGPDREQGYYWFTTNFFPGQTYEIACETDPG
jgi:spectinomycin phosphotransferase